MDIGEFQSFRNSTLFKRGLYISEPGPVVDFDTVHADFLMLFVILDDRAISDVHKRLALDYYNNFQVKISYPKEITIEGKFIIGKNSNDEYEFDTYERGDFILNDILQQDKEQVKGYKIVVMMSSETCNLVVFFDDFLQAGDQLESGKILENAEYRRIPHPTRQSCKEFYNVVKSRKKFDNKMAVGGKHKKKRKKTTKRVKNSKRKRTKRVRFN